MPEERAFLANDKPVFKADTFEHFSPPAYLTSILTEGYACGVVRIAFKYGDIDENDTPSIVFTANMRPHPDPADKVWMVNANFLTHGRDELITADVLCVNQAYIKGGTPP